MTSSSSKYVVMHFVVVYMPINILSEYLFRPSLVAVLVFMDKLLIVLIRIKWLIYWMQHPVASWHGNCQHFVKFLIKQSQFLVMFSFIKYIIVMIIVVSYIVCKTNLYLCDSNLEKLYVNQNFHINTAAIPTIS